MLSGQQFTCVDVIWPAVHMLTAALADAVWRAVVLVTAYLEAQDATHDSYSHSASPCDKLHTRKSSHSSILCVWLAGCMFIQTT
jgi:hypothetical protein